MRVGEIRRGEEDERENWIAGFFGTRYEDLGDWEDERRRKLAISDPYESPYQAAEDQSSGTNDLAELKARSSSPRLQGLGEELDAMVSVQQANKESDRPSTSNDYLQRTVSSTPCIDIEGRRCPPSIDGLFDGSASPGSSKRTRSNQSAIIANHETAAVEWKAEEKFQGQIEQDKSGHVETQLVVKDVASSIGEVVQEVIKVSFVAEGDDTEYLNAFLTRAKAKKAARTILSREGQVSNDTEKLLTSSPHTRSRTALASLDKNSPSPKKTRKIEAPMEKLDHKHAILSEVATTSPLRKSSRTRLPQPQQHQPETPSNIAFRRSNGTEFVFLQKTEAQQVAIATRSNTRRNKGEALQPKMKLEALSSRMQSSPVKVARKQKNNKQVSWDEGLAYFAPKDRATMDINEERVEQKTPVKRSRRLAQGRGTPAPKKKMAEAAMDVGTPLPRTRTQTRGKV